MEEADRKIDGLADSGQLNPALLLTMAKAYSAAKDTNITKEEVKEIMGHLYFKVLSLSRPLHTHMTSLPGMHCRCWCTHACCRLQRVYRSEQRLLIRVHLMNDCLYCASLLHVHWYTLHGNARMRMMSVSARVMEITLLSVNSCVQAKESFAKMQPPEVRILKHLLTLDSPAQRAEEMRNAFTPGPEIETEKQDYLNT